MKLPSFGGQIVLGEDCWLWHVLNTFFHVFFTVFDDRSFTPCAAPSVFSLSQDSRRNTKDTSKSSQRQGSPKSAGQSSFCPIKTTICKVPIFEQIQLHEGLRRSPHNTLTIRAAICDGSNQILQSIFQEGYHSPEGGTCCFSHGWQDKYEQLEFLCQFCKFQRNLAGWYFRSVKGEGQ
jgi:hypothetical protein